MKKFKINIKYYKEIDMYVAAKNKKEAQKMVQDVMNSSNLIEVLKVKEENFIYKVMENDYAKK